jgi:hypothetical protein
MTGDTLTAPPRTLDELRAEFKDWRFFESGKRLFAFRADGSWQSTEGPESLLLVAVSAPDPAALWRRLAMQEWLDSLSAEELTRLWERETGGKR